jgi:tetratricopeptide (TPR) repeat protein
MKRILIAVLALTPVWAAETPVVLYPGLGAWHHAIATRNAEAQKFFDQGLSLLYGFNRYEALRSFRKAAELDSRAAMAYWGIAMALGPHVNMDGDGDVDLKAGCEALQTGLRLTGVAAGELAYLEAAATRCPAYDPAKYIAAMKALAARYPDDLDAQTLYAESLMIPIRWKWYAADGTPAAGELEAEHALEGVLRRWPTHAGANHFYIHAVESSKTPERAVPSAQRLMAIVPAAGHLVHMPGHIWLVLGDWETAASVNERAAELDRRYFASSNVTTSAYSGYYVHNLHFILYSRLMQGRRAESLRAAEELGRGMAPMLTAMPEMAAMMQPFAAWPVFTQVRLGEWDALMKLPRPDDKLSIGLAMWRYARTLALVARGDQAGAVQEQRGFEDARAKVAADSIWGNNRSADVLAMAGEILAARVAGSPALAVPHWERAVAMQDALVYDEPPAWYYPVRESLGAALLRAGRAGDAEAAFRDGIARVPRNGRMLFGLMESLRAQGKNDAAELVRSEFDAAWQKADVKLTIDSL